MRNWLMRLTQRRAVAPVAPVARGRQRADAAGERVSGDGPDGEGAPPTCGWFESSWELERGLRVLEVSALEEAVWRLVAGEASAADLAGRTGTCAPAGYFSGPV